MAVLSGTITEADKSFVETWENISVNQNGIIRLDVRGEERPEIISGRRTFMLSTAERIITQDRIVEVAHDPFLNGAFRPVVVPESVNIESNPNALSDDEIMRIFKSSPLAWSEYLKVISSPETLRRMVDLADESEDITFARVRQLTARLLEVKPRTRVTQRDADQYEKMSPSSAPGGPGESRGAERRGQGGRSADYRT
jgi:hypothetical protein